MSLESGFDLCTKAGQEEAWTYIEEIDTDTMIIAWPCTAWCSIQNLNTEPGQRERLEKLQQEQRKLTRFVERLANRARGKNRMVMVEQPQTSKARHLPDSVSATRAMDEVITNMCMHGLTCPETQVPLRKAT